jgi:phosphoadenosine phosphosulfate reductase
LAIRLGWGKIEGFDQADPTRARSSYVHITMVKKQLANGEPCEKCAQTEEMLRRRGLWEKIDEVVLAIEGDAESPGILLGQEHGVVIAPFFIVREDDDSKHIYKSGLKLVRDRFPDAPTTIAPVPPGRAALPDLAKRLANSAPEEILKYALERYGERCTIAFSGAEDIVLIDMATRLGLPFRVFTLDTGRLHGETYEFIDEVRRRYGVMIDVIFPEATEVSDLVQRKGPNSFYQDGHAECCAIRKIRPLGRTLAHYDAWVTGQRRDQSPATRSGISVVLEDSIHGGAGDLLVKFNPLATWSGEQVWHYIRENNVPFNPLHETGFVSIGCEPCTRATASDQHEREGRWWWETADARECGLHTSGDGI